jgi:hypothetical protein
MESRRPAGPFPLLDGLVAYSDPGLVQNRRSAEVYSTSDQIKLFADFVITTAHERSDPTIRHIDDSARTVLSQTRESLVEPFRGDVASERLFLRGVPAGSPPSSPHELIPNGWALELEFHFGNSSVRHLMDRWISVVVTTLPPRREELATARRLVDAAEHQEVGEVRRGALPLTQALLAFSEPEIRYEFTQAEAELVSFKQILAGVRPRGSTGPLIGLDPIGRDLTEHRLLKRHKQAKAVATLAFLDRVARGDVILTGLQTKPELAPARARLSTDWVRHMVIDWDRHAIRVEQAVFIDVQADLKPTKAPPRVATLGPKKAARPRGRPGFPLDLFVAIAGAPDWVRVRARQRDTEALIEAFKRHHPTKSPPEFSTVLNHRQRIYEAVDAGAATVKSVKSV